MDPEFIFKPQPLGNQPYGELGLLHLDSVAWSYRVSRFKHDDDLPNRIKALCCSLGEYRGTILFILEDIQYS